MRTYAIAVIATASNRSTDLPASVGLGKAPLRLLGGVNKPRVDGAAGRDAGKEASVVLRGGEAGDGRDGDEDARVQHDEWLSSKYRCLCGRRERWR